MARMTTSEISLTLPYPPSMNHYWRTRVVKANGKQAFSSTYVSRKGKEFQSAVAMTCGGGRRFVGPVSVRIELYPPDRRKRDIDNAVKPLLDALTIAGVWGDDSQVDRLEVTRESVESEGKAVVCISGNVEV